MPWWEEIRRLLDEMCDVDWINRYLDKGLIAPVASLPFQMDRELIH